MAPTLALLIVLLFITWLFHGEKLRGEELSWQMIVPQLWFLIIASREVSRWIHPQSAGDEVLDYATALSEGSSLDRNIYLLLILFGLIIVMFRSGRIFNLLKRNWPPLLFYAFAFASIVWAEFPVVALKRFVKVGGSLLMILIVLSETDPFAAIKAMIRWCGYLLIPLSLVFIKYFPQLGRGWGPSGTTDYHGVTTQKNSLGILSMICCLYFFWEFLAVLNDPPGRKRKRELFAFGLLALISFWLLVITQSATSLVCLFLGVAIILVMKVPLIANHTGFIGAYIATMLLLFLAGQMMFDLKTLLVSFLGRDMTLTGRTVLWDETLSFPNNRFIGYGFGNFWLGERIEFFWEKYWWLPKQAHNGYIETYLNLGLIGVGVVGIILIDAYRRSSREIKYDVHLGGFRMAIFFIFIVSNITEASIPSGGTLGMLWFMFLMVSAMDPLYGTWAETEDTLLLENGYFEDYSADNEEKAEQTFSSS
ncbi:MAG: hypothetical protein GF401_00170 [Chitinivibrionales bacterium]|nr:hypothetical protein [Chitinivibrionales bacterium]